MDLAPEPSAVALELVRRLVPAMTVEAWQGVRARLARIISRRNDKEQSTFENRLERDRQELLKAEGDDRERVARDISIAWRTRIGDILEANPDIADELRALLGEMEANVPTQHTAIVRAYAWNHGQNFVSGTGDVSITLPPARP